MTVALACLSAALALGASPVSGEVVRPSDSARAERRTFRRAVYAGTASQRATALQAGLKSADPIIRRQTLWELYADDRVAASRALLSLTADPAEDVGLMVVRLAGGIPSADKRRAFLQKVVRDSPLPSVREAATYQMNRSDEVLEADNNVSADVNALSPFGACVSRLGDLGMRLREIPSLRKAATGPRPSRVASSSADLLVWVATQGSADYVFAVNDASGEDQPVAGEIRLERAAGAVYDLVRHVPVPFSVADGRMAIRVELQPRGALALMVVPEPLKPLKGVSAKVHRGLAVTLYSQEKGILVPVEIAAPGLRAPQVAVIDGGEWDRVFSGMRLPVTVRNLADGRTMRIVE